MPMELRVSRAVALDGQVRPPSDKSLTHRALLFGAIADGQSLVENPLTGEDAISTARCLEAMGCDIDWSDPTKVIIRPAREWTSPAEVLDCGNSGTTMRLLSGLIASRLITATLVGDLSLSKRPMKRVAAPLRQMGATVDGDYPPLRITGSQLRGIEYESPVASAQVKSAVLLAGLRAEGETWVKELEQSRDHTERMLQALGVPLMKDERKGVGVKRAAPNAFRFTVPADISSASFWLVAATLLEGSHVEMIDVGVNPTRTGIFDVLRQVGADYFVADERDSLGEPVANIVVRGSQNLAPFAIEGPLVPRLVDEIPVLAVLATQCDGITSIRDAQELRVKESDRIEIVANGLRSMGAKVETFDDGLEIEGPTPLSGTRIEAQGDHRIAMAFAVAGLIAAGETTIGGSEAIQTSYPEFERHLARLVVV